MSKITLYSYTKTMLRRDLKYKLIWISVFLMLIATVYFLHGIITWLFVIILTIFVYGAIVDYRAIKKQ
ncbi:hypothetical protein AWR31_08055 [Campylobacter fetus subsp. venerealis]|nr:hypothetical protein AWR31_08055 [Campylobacter fetus subsp. venerealis]